MVSLAKRTELCAKFGYTCQWEDMYSKRTGGGVVTLEEPSNKPAKGTLAEVGEECFFSSIYYLLVGRKSGIKNKQFWSFLLLKMRH